MQNNLHFFETLHARDITHKIVKRGAAFSYHPYNTIKEVEFKTLGRRFRLILHPHKEIVHGNFQAYEVKSDGKPQTVVVDHDHFYAGRVFGESESSVRAHIDAKGVVTATILLPEETYHIEPSWRHLNGDKNNRQMISYRLSDVKLSWDDGGNRTEVDPAPVNCGFVKEGLELETDDGLHTTVAEYYESLWNRNQFKRPDRVLTALNRQNAEVKVRKKRQSDQYEYTPMKTRCPLLLVADYRFFQEMGGSNTKTTINYLVKMDLYFAVILLTIDISFNHSDLVDRPRP